MAGSVARFGMQQYMGRADASLNKAQLNLMPLYRGSSGCANFLFRTQWHHAGSLEAATCSDLLVIYCGSFHQPLCYHPELLKPVRLYAQMVVHTVNLSPGYMQDVWHEYRNTR